MTTNTTIFIFLIMFIFRQLMAYFQIRHISQKYSTLCRKYAGDYFIGMNTKRKMGEPLCILVVNATQNIEEIHMLKGIFIHQKVKQLKFVKPLKLQDFFDGRENYLYKFEKVDKRSAVAIKNTCQVIEANVLQLQSNL